jgi:CRP-like cAMP-binding protein
VVLDTRDGDAIVVPNALLLAQPFTLLGKREGDPDPHRQAVTFRVDYRHPPAHVCEVVLAALRASPNAHVSETPAPGVVCLELGRAQEDSSALYAVRYWITDLSRDTMIDSDVRARVHAGLRRAGIPLALPTVSNLNAEADDADGQRSRRTERAFTVLRGLDLFAALSDAECARLAEGVAHVPFAPGEVITRQGAVAHFLYVVASGTVEVRVASEGQPTRTWDLHAPAFFGEMGLLTGEPRRASVIARTPVACLKLDRALFEEVLVQRPEVANGLAEAIARRQAELDSSVTSTDPNGPPRVSSASIATAIRGFFGL